MSGTLPGSVLTEADFETLQKSWISRELATQAMLRRVTSPEGAQLVGRNGSGSYAGIVFPYLYPGFDIPCRYGLRRDKSELVVNAKGEPEESGHYLAGPGRNNSFYFVPGTAKEVLDDPEIPVIFAVGEESTLALHRLSQHELAADAKPRFLPLGLAGPWNWRCKIGKAPSCLTA